MPAANNIRQTLTRFASLLTGRGHSRHQSRIAILGTKCISDLKEYSDGLFIINNRLMAESFSKASIADYFDGICALFTHFVGCMTTL